MKIGVFTVPHANLRAVSMLWDNTKDREYTEAIQELRKVSNGVRQLVIKVDEHKASYPTTKMIEWFMNQHWDRGIRYSTNDKGHMIAIKTSTRYRVFIPNLWLLVGDDVYRLTPQMHIYPSENDEHLTEDRVFPIYTPKRVQYYEARSEYAYYKYVFKLISVEEENKTKEVKRKKEAIDFEPAVFRSICDLYEMDYTDEKAFEQIEYYVMNKLPIVRMPRDEYIYELCVAWGIAPSHSQLNDVTYTDIYDDSNITYIGKESYLETYEEQENDF